MSALNNPTPANAGYVINTNVIDTTVDIIPEVAPADAPADTPVDTTGPAHAASRVIVTTVPPADVPVDTIVLSSTGKPTKWRGAFKNEFSRVQRFIAALPREYVVPRMGIDDVTEEEVEEREVLWKNARDGVDTLEVAYIHDALMACARITVYLPIGATTRARRVPAIDGIMSAVEKRALTADVPEEVETDAPAVTAEVVAAVEEIHALLVGSVMDLRQVLAATMETMAFAWAEAWGDIANIEGRRQR